ncbi:DEAD/DEAH box helicase [Brachybacterium tyrofermentans]|uniref:DEAD/DEAH box helicase n=1 Tax=Brachybacterium tyrofermentans TaxID=47848 RepID=UPI003FD4E9FF
MNADTSLPYVSERDIIGFAGSAAAQRGKRYSRSGAVGTVSWEESAASPRAGTLIVEGEVHGTRPTPYRTRVTLRESLGRAAARVAAASWGLTAREPVDSWCTCPVGTACKHAAALLYTVTAEAMRTGMRDAPEVAPEFAVEPEFAAEPQYEPEHGFGSSPASRSPELSPRPSPSPWRRALAPLIEVTASRETTALAIGVELLSGARGRAFSRYSSVPATIASLKNGASVSIGLRPLRAGTAKPWIKGGLSWSAFQYSTPQLQSSRSEFSADHAELLGRLARAAALDQPYGGSPGEHLLLEDLSTRDSWELLAQTVRAGVPLVGLGVVAGVTWQGPARVHLDVQAHEGDLLVSALAEIDGEPRDGLRPAGPSGLLDIRTGTPAGTAQVVLIPTAQPLPETVRQLLAHADTLRVPASDAEEFLRDVAPQLRSIIEVTSTGDSVEFPEPAPARLELEVRHLPADRVDLHWSWAYDAPRRRAPVGRELAGPRDAVHEAAVLDSVREHWDEAATQAEQQLSGADAAAFVDRVLPALQALEHLEVHERGTRPRYAELRGDPSLRITQAESAAPQDNDWFDLGFEVTIDEQPVPFTAVFMALFRGEPSVLLPDGTYFRLDHPTYDRLRTLIEEAGTMDDWEPDSQRISRYQVSLWDELEDLADSTFEARAWRESVGALKALEQIAAPETPPGLQATLRPYQHEGFAWLSFLYDHRLGGILADDMGLGKTLQTLAMIVRARTLRPDAPPFLVIAPSSVLSMWKSEAGRFAPQLDVRVLDSTTARRGTSVADAAAGADIVVTSYTLLRIDDEEYAAPDWDGLILDEAQFVKNRVTKAHRAARRIRAPFRLAITGTPMENSLSDIWAILSLTAQGLYPSWQRFRQEYLTPIERAEPGEEGRLLSEERMARLRRRIRPFMLRRGKDAVASDLPPKQEQVVRVPLQTVHRRLYDRVLQRERQKMLKLLEDMDRNRFVVFRSLTLLRMLALDPAIVAEEHAKVPSSKLDALLEHLDEILAEQHRVIIFSQFTSHLARVGQALEDRGVRYAYLDGSTRDRAGVIDSFRSGDQPAFLISLKAGGFGLTLTEADYVFLLDPWWNPAAEAQAVDRAHRIGQTRNVMVYRMVAENTIEDKVLALQERKAALFSALTDGDEAFNGALSAEDVRELLVGDG